jgi:hypothetical protein
VSVVIGLTVVVGAILAGILVAGNCDAPDWQQGLMLTVLPLVCGLGAVVAALPAGTGNSRPRKLGVLAAGFLGAAGSLVLFIAVWGASCSA